MLAIAVIVLCILYLIGLPVGTGLAITTLAYVGLNTVLEILRRIELKNELTNK